MPVTPDPLTEARLRLAMTPGFGPILTQRAEQLLGGPLAVTAASVADLIRVDGIGRKKAEQLHAELQRADPSAELKRIAALGAAVLSLSDPDYPPLLRHIPDPPTLLYVRGKLQRQDSLALAIVGARRCTTYGREQADRLAGLCAQAGLTIVSGGAWGIDAAAHRAALRNGGRTLAVLGSGLSNPYPKEHADLFDQIADGRGAVISELPMTTPPIAENFPRRNRIISGLSLGVLVVEAALRSGALITARLAAEEHHREVLALPGRADSPTSAGCHKIIREGWATLVTGPADILDALGEAGQTLKAALDFHEQPTTLFDSPASADPSTGSHEPPTPSTPAGLPDDVAKVLLAVAPDPTEIDAVCRDTGISAGLVQAHLMRLQLAGHVERLPGNRVRRRA